MMIYGNCEICGGETSSKYRSTLPRTCSKECACKLAWKNSNRHRGKIIIKYCAQCGKEIQLKSKDYRLKTQQTLFFCSHQCSADYHNAQLEEHKNTCKNCGKTLIGRGKKGQKRRFCNRKCQYEYAHKNKMTDEQKKIRNHENWIKIKSKRVLTQFQDHSHRRTGVCKYKGRVKEYMREYYAKNKDILSVREKQRKLIDPVYALKIKIRKMTSQYVKRSFTAQKDYVCKYLGCNIFELRKYLQELFQPGMSAENYGEWEIDHKTPLCWASSEEDLLKAAHYTNIRPMWKSDNKKKCALDVLGMKMIKAAT